MIKDIFKICSYLVHKGIQENLPLSNISMQKILYFAQGIHLAEFGSPLFTNKIYAWEYGPVIKEVYHKFKKFGNNHITNESQIENLLGEDFLNLKSDLSKSEQQFLSEIWNSFKEYAPFQLVALTHIPGSPWHSIYRLHDGNPPRDTVIPINIMNDYFILHFAA
jgi:uncharacterized phage-associated protein